MKTEADLVEEAVMAGSEESDRISKLLGKNKYKDPAWAGQFIFTSGADAMSMSPARRELDRRYFMAKTEAEIALARYNRPRGILSRLFG